MRRDGLHHTSRTLRGCCAGNFHRLPSPVERTEETPLLPGQTDRVPNCCGGAPKGAKRCYGHNYSHVARCGMCKPGRRRGAGGCRALKKVSGSRGSRGNNARAVWLAVVREAREATKGGLELHLDDLTLFSLPAELHREEANSKKEQICQGLTPALENRVEPPPVADSAADARPPRRSRFRVRSCRCCAGLERSADAMFSSELSKEADWVVI